VSTSRHPMTIVLVVLIVAAVLILGAIFLTATLVICRRRSVTSQLQQDERDAFKQRQEQRLNVYNETPGPSNTATVFAVPTNHVPRGCCTDSVPRVRFRTDSTDLQGRRSVYIDEGEDSPVVGSRRNQSTNGKLKLLLKNKTRPPPQWARLISLLLSSLLLIHSSKRGKVEVFGNNSDKSKLDSRRN
jgi:hypothetical protein